jgi:hypothetical protein
MLPSPASANQTGQGLATRQMALVCRLDDDAIVWQPVDELPLEPLVLGFRLPVRQVFE